MESDLKFHKDHSDRIIMSNSRTPVKDYSMLTLDPMLVSVVVSNIYKRG